MTFAECPTCGFAGRYASVGYNPQIHIDHMDHARPVAKAKQEREAIHHMTVMQ